MNPATRFTAPQTPQRRRIILLIVLSVGGLTFGAYRLWDTWAFNLLAAETQGQIVARNGLTFTIQYVVDGRTFQITEDLPGTKGMSGTTRMQLHVGAMVPVLYEPSSPNNARWEAERNWVFPLGILFVSVLAGFAGLFPDIAGRSIRRNSSASD